MKRYVAAALGLLTLSAIAGVWSARVPEAQAYAEALSTAEVQKLVPHYPGAQLLDLGGPVHVDGQPRRLAYALTPDSPHKVADRYAGVFQSQGLRVESRQVGKEEWVTATNRQTGLIITIAAAPNERGTVIIASITRMFDAPKKMPLALPESCGVITRTGGDDPRASTEMVLARCQAPVAMLVNYFERVYASDEKKHQLSDSKSFLHYAGDTRELMVGIEPVPEKPQESVITLHWQARR